MSKQDREVVETINVAKLVNMTNTVDYSIQQLYLRVTEISVAFKPDEERKFIQDQIEMYHNLHKYDETGACHMNGVVWRISPFGKNYISGLHGQIYKHLPSTDKDRVLKALVNASYILEDRRLLNIRKELNYLVLAIDHDLDRDWLLDLYDHAENLAYTQPSLMSILLEHKLEVLRTNTIANKAVHIPVALKNLTCLSETLKKCTEHFMKMFPTTLTVV